LVAAEVGSRRSALGVQTWYRLVWLKSR
jgi:hypothetical protein